jgi:serine/threonine protein kinase
MHLDILTVQFNLKYLSTFNVNQNERLDENSNFRVFTGTLGRENLSIAAKLIPLTDFKLQEVIYIREIQHENVISYYGVTKHLQDQYYIVMPRFDCNLRTYLNEYTGRLDSDTMDQMIIQIIKGLDYIHTQLELVHRDIKSQNILVNKAKNLFVIADLGGAHREPITLVYTEGYAAPELFSRDNPGMITEKCDIYSLGIVIREIIQSVNIERDNDGLINVWSKISQRCCSEESSERPSCKEILEQRIRHDEL